MNNDIVLVAANETALMAALKTDMVNNYRKWAGE